MTTHPPGGYVDRVNERIAADRRVLAEAETFAERMDRTIGGQCPWCGGTESVIDSGEVTVGFHDPDGCDLEDLLGALRRPTPAGRASS